MTRVTLAARIAVALLALPAAACAGGGQPTASGPAQPGLEPTTATTSEPDTPAETTSASTAASEVLAFTARTLDGGTFDASTLRGEDVALWMWAPW